MRSIILACLVSCLIGSVHARTWTDDRGRTVDAEILRIDGDDPVVSLRGKEVKLPAAKLSPADHEFLDKWKLDHPVAPAAAATPAATPPPAGLSLGDIAIVGGGKQNIIEKPFPADVIKDLKKQDGATTFKLAISIPAGFDPAKPMKVYVVSTAVNNDAERTGGNIAKFNMYAGSCTAQGWVCMAVDTDKGFPSTEHAISAACALLSKEWPGFAQGSFAVGGFSGGSKACFFNAAWLGKNKYNLAGAYLGGCNHDTSEEYRKELKTPNAAFRKMKVYVGTGKTDTIASPAAAEGVGKSLKDNGIRNVRVETHEGGHSMSGEQFVQALKWFAEADKA